MTYFVYMLECEHNKIYTGVAKDVEARFQTHIKGAKTGGAKFTSANKPIRILYKKEFETMSDAMKEEIRIKKLAREDKIKLIEGI